MRDLNENRPHPHIPPNGTLAGERDERLATIRPDGTDVGRLSLRILGDSGTWAPDGSTRVPLPA